MFPRAPHACVLSRVRLLVTPRTAAHQAPLSMGFPGQEYLSGLPFPTPGDLPNQTRVSRVSGRQILLPLAIFCGG